MSEHNKQFLSTPHIPTMEVVHDDERRTIREAELEQFDGTIRRVTSIAIKAATDGQPVILGNHYHDRTEDFAVISGAPKIVTAPEDNPSDRMHHEFPDGGFISMKPGEAHAFVFTQPGELRSTMSGTFEEGGLHPHKLL